MRYLITSALPYINGMKHLGNLVGSMLPADVYARFLRSEGEEVLLICATDEHGTPAEIAALEAGLDVADYCERQHRLQADVYRRFGLSFDHFGRTSAPQNHEVTQRFYLALERNGFIEEKQLLQCYSPDDGRFLPDRYVIGTCPRCGYNAARGDQCENCTCLLEPTELVGPRSAVSGSTVIEFRATDHLFLDLEVLSGRVRSWVESHPEWPRLTTSIALKWLDEGLKNRCITRDLTWGVRVPRPGFQDKVFYVWFDAPIGYVGATKEWSDLRPSDRDWPRWWLDADDVYYVQFMAKDNLPFHTVFWPASILGTGEPWTLPSYIKGFNWLTYYGGKFSTSQKRGVFMDKALEILPPDYWRYFLMAHAPETDDSDFTWELFAATINKDLVGNFGNFVNRTLKLIESRVGRRIPVGGAPGDREARLTGECSEVLGECRQQLRAMEFRKAVSTLRRLWSLGNVYVDERAPWKLLKEDPEQASIVLRTAVNLARVFAVAAWPFIPFTAEAVFEALHLEPEERTAHPSDPRLLTRLGGKRPFDVPPLLFRRIEETEIARLREEYGG
ncbi:MAG: methionine--tRNA ligase [Bacillota bacterium]|nr:methionine--tRNA ligase [Bacillota bacterium]